MSSLFMCTNPFMQRDSSESTQFLKGWYLKSATLRIKFHPHNSVFQIQHKSPAICQRINPKISCLFYHANTGFFPWTLDRCFSFHSARRIICPNATLLTRFVKPFLKHHFYLEGSSLCLQMFLPMQNSGLCRLWFHLICFTLSTFLSPSNIPYKLVIDYFRKKN